MIEQTRKEPIRVLSSNTDLDHFRMIHKVHDIHRKNRRKIDKATGSPHESSELSPFSGKCSLCGAQINGDGSNLKNGHLICGKCKKDNI